MRSYLSELRILLCLTIILVALGSGCKRKASDNTDADKPETGPSSIKTETDTGLAEPNAAEISPNDIAVTVNGINIMEAELTQAMKQQIDALAQQAKAANLPPAFLEQYRKQIKPRILDSLINNQLLSEKIKEAKIVVSDEEVTNQIEELISNQSEPLTLEEFEKKAAEQGLNFEDLKKSIRKRLAYDKLMTVQLEGKISVTEEDAKKYYDENPKLFEQPEQIASSHILIKPEPIDPNSEDPNEALKQSKEAAMAKARDLLKQIKDGADFAELAKANSECPSAKDGGDLGFLPRGQLTPPFEEAAFTLELGQLSDIVETSYGFHIIKNTGHKEAGVITFEQANKSITDQLVQKQKRELVEEYMKKLKAEAVIVYPPGKEPVSDVNNP